MVLIILSLIMGYIGLNIGGLVSELPIFGYLFAVVGTLSPGLYMLEKIYKEIKKK